MVWDGVGWCGMVWDGVGWCGMVWDGVGWCGMVWDGVGWCGMVWDGVGWCGMVWDGVGVKGKGGMSQCERRGPAMRPVSLDAGKDLKDVLKNAEGPVGSHEAKV